MAAALRSACLTARVASALLLPALVQAAVPGSMIVNQATLSTALLPAVQASVSVRVATISFLRYANSGGVAAAAAPRMVDVQPMLCGGNTLATPAFGPVGGLGNLPTLPSSYPLNLTTQYQVGEPVFLEVEDPGSNLSPTAQDTLGVTVRAVSTGDSETLLLEETAPSSGIFAGFINTTRRPAAADCLLSVRDGDHIFASYRSEQTDEVELVDPYGVAFDAETGTRLDGASVTLIDDLTGLPAQVVGDDGEPYPSTVTTGGTVTTTTRSYSLLPGEFRFPYVTPGRNYHFTVSRSSYLFPSSHPDSDFTGPAFAGLLVTTGSRGESFAVPLGSMVRVDLPLDPVGSGLLLVKNAARTLVAIGDFVPYNLVASNRSGSTLPNVQVQDTLPPGFRYRAGSLKLNGVVQPDPQIGPDGRQLTMALGNIADNRDARVTYVAEATAATPLGEAVNTARAASGALQSNVARASVRVREELLRSRALLAGRVLEVASCAAADIAQATPVPGARIYLEDGRYVLTDVRGRWHLDDIRPGSHVVQLDEQGLSAGVELMSCANNSRAAGSAFSQFVDVQGGTLWQTDFYLRRPQSLHMRMQELQRQLGLRLTSESISGGLRYTLSFTHTDTAFEQAALQISLPTDLQFVPGSLQVNGEAHADPAADGQSLTLALPELAVVGSGSSSVNWDVALGPTARAGHHAVIVQFNGVAGGHELETEVLENQAGVVVPERAGRVIIFRPRFASYSTELAAADKRWLDDIVNGELKNAGDIRMEVVGHTDDVRVVPRKGRAINDNYALSLGRAQSVADYLKQKLGLADDRIQAIGKGPDEPIADNKTPKGRDLNRRVELKVYAMGQVEAAYLEVQHGDSGPHEQQWSEWHSEAVSAAEDTAADTKAEPAPEDNGIGLLSHKDGEVVADRVQALRLRVDSRLKTDIRLDGAEIPEDRLGFRKDEGKTTLMSYIGVDLGEPGPHVLTVKGTDPFGIVRVDQHVTVVVASDITRIRPAQNPDNVADGRTPLAVKVELVDASGRTVPAAVELRLVNSGGLRPLVTTDAQRAVADSAGKIPVGTDGIMKFAPVTRSGLYTIEVAYNNAVEKIPVYVHPEKRDWILVALAEGSLAAKTISGNMQSAQAAGADDSLFQDGRAAFFAKGQIQGKWLLTMAYDSGRESTAALGGAIDPARFYTLYADATDPRFDAPSKEKLYLRIERDAFYALFGDFDTGMTEVELGRYNRSMTGLKSEYHDQRFDVNVFAADTGRGFVRDEMRGDGTSGLYHLRAHPLLAGSEKVRIETRDRFKSEVVLESQTLARWADYNIDYDSGELFFKAPVPSQDSNLNPVWIVVEYETEVSGGDALNAGGRAAMKFNDGKAVVGVSTVQEQNGINQGGLNAVDASYRATPADTVRLEIADSSVTSTLGDHGGSAELLEWKHDSQKIKGRAYYREQEGGFGLGQQSGSEEGTRKLGVEGRYQLHPNTALTADLFQQEMLTSGNSREVIDLRDEVTRDRYGYGIGLRHVDESLATGPGRSADQLALSGRYALPDNKLKLRSNLELGLAGNSESTDFPDRFLLGADYQLSRKVQLTLEQEWAMSALRDTETTRVGVQAQPWRGAKIGTHLDQETADSGQRLRAGLGLGQNLTLTPDWTLDLGYDRAETLKNNQTTTFNPALPSTFGPVASDFWAATIGGNYRHLDIKGVARLERRDASDEQRWNLVGGLYRELNPEMAVAVGLTAVMAEHGSGEQDDNVLLRGSFAWRPDDARWLLLDRLDLGIDRKITVANALDGRRLVNNLNANRRWQDNQLSLEYGTKFVFDTIDNTRYTGLTDLIGVEWRHDLNPRWDIGWRNSMLHSWTPGVMDYSYGIAVGMTPTKNAWVSLGYNFEGFTDGDFGGGEYSAQGIYLKLRLKFDQHSVRQIWSDSRGVFGSGSADTAPATAPEAPAPAAAPEAAANPAPAAPADPVELVPAAPSAPQTLLIEADGAVPVPSPDAPAAKPAAKRSAGKKAVKPATTVKPATAAKQSTAVKPAVPVKQVTPVKPAVTTKLPAAPAPKARLSEARLATIVHVARARQELAARLPTEVPKESAHKLHRGEDMRRRERLQRNEEKVQKLLKPEAAAGAAPTPASVNAKAKAAHKS